MPDSTLLARLLTSVFFRRAQRRAGRYATRPQRLGQVALATWDKLRALRGDSTATPDFVGQVNTLARLVRAYARGQYRAVPWRTLALVVAVLLYFLSPIDLLPDFLPLVGLTDDVALVWWLVQSLATDLTAFRTWEATRPIDITHEVITE